MLKTRITEQYGLKVPFINAGMAFIATAPLVRAVCSAGGMGMLGTAAMPSDVLQAAIRDIKAIDPVSYGVLRQMRSRHGFVGGDIGQVRFRYGAGQFQRVGAALRQRPSGQRRQLLSERIAQFGIDKLDWAHEWWPSVCDKQNDKANNWRCIQELTSEIPLPLI